jgi:hypothetical protein
MSSKKKLKNKINMLASIIAKMITPVFTNQTSTMPLKKITYYYGKRGLQ